jgi:cellulose synthase operon protein C
MKNAFRRPLTGLLLAATLALAGCQSSEEKAEGYFRSGMELLAAGDEDRALVEFRNVFKYNGFHKEARKTYADTVLKQGKTGEAYSQYLRLIEQYPDTPEVRLILAELAISNGSWDEAERHGTAAVQLAPDMPGVPAIRMALAYRAAVLDEDETTRNQVAEEARTLLEADPASLIARRILIDRLMTGPDPQSALPVIEVAIEQSPETLEFQMLKFRLLALANDTAGTGAHLRRMYALFPQNEDVQRALIGWYLVQQDLDGAEAFLRSLAGEVTGDPKGHVTVVQFLQQARQYRRQCRDLSGAGRHHRLRAGPPDRSDRRP